MGWRTARQVDGRRGRRSTTPTCAPRSQRAVDDANEAVSKAESIRKFVVLASDFTEEAGQLTPTLKLRRDVVLKDFATQVDEPVRVTATSGGGLATGAGTEQTGPVLRRSRAVEQPYAATAATRDSPCGSSG